MIIKNDLDNEFCIFDGLLKMYYEFIEVFDFNDNKVLLKIL